MTRKSLGTLTVDLIARAGGFIQGMDKAERHSAEWRRSVERDLKTISTAAKTTAVAIGATLVGSVTALTKSGLDTVDAQATLAKSLGTTYDSITQLNAAFSDGGIDDFEGSLNRLNRRLGAAELGRGAALKTVQELNLNLTELSKLDAAERVAVIADRIKAVAKNSQQAARFAQDLGFEQKEAAQFFLEGGDAIRKAADHVRDYGLSLSEVDVAKVQIAAGSFVDIGDATQAASQQLAVAFAPAIVTVNDLIKEMILNYVSATEEADSFADVAIKGFAFVADAADGVVRVVNVIGVVLGGLAAAAVNDMKALGQAINNGAREIAAGVLNFVPFGGSLAEQLLMGRSGSAEATAAGTTAIFSAMRADIDAILLAPMPSNNILERYQEAVEDLQEQAEKQVAAQEKQRIGWEAINTSVGSTAKTYLELKAIYDKVAAAQLAYNKQTQEIADSTASATEKTELVALAQKKLNEAINGSKKSYIEVKAQYDAATAAAVDYQKAVEAITESSATYEEQLELIAYAQQNFDASLAELEEKDYWTKWLEGAEEALTTFNDLAANVYESFTANFGNAFESMIMDASSLKDAIGGLAIAMTRSIVNALGQMAAQWLVYQVVTKAANKGAAASAAGVMTASAIGAQQLAAANSYASAAAIPFTGWIQAPAAAAGALAATSPFVAGASAAANSIVGMAHDGIDSIPSEGTWLLDKGERVVDSRTNQDLKDFLKDTEGRGQGVTIYINAIEDRERAGEIEEEDGEAQNEKVINIFVSDLVNDGKSAQALQSKFGLSTRGF